MSEDFNKDDYTDQQASLHNEETVKNTNTANDMSNNQSSSVYRYTGEDLNRQSMNQNAQHSQYSYGNQYSANTGSGQRNPNTSNGYAAYGPNGMGGMPYGQQPVRKKKKMKQRKVPTWVKMICYGLIFGLIAGSTFEGIHLLGKHLWNKTEVAEEPVGSIGVVKVSSDGVVTFESNDVSDIVESVMPSIVAVNTVVETKTQDFFGRIYSQEGEGAGSGFIFSSDAEHVYIITNYHVIEDSKSIQVTFFEDSAVDAIVKGYDEKEDIAVLEINASEIKEETKSQIKAAVLGDSDALKPGNGAIAIGNALGYGQSVTTGCISAVAREVALTDGSMSLIQTSAAINPGNSGGALLNAKGEVIGINTVKYSDTKVEGMGFAIPINSALVTVQDIISGKIVNRSDSDSAYLGIKGGTIDEATAKSYGYPQGVYVSSVYSNSAAHRGGIQAGAIITKFNDVDIVTMEDLQECLSKCSPGDRVTMHVINPNRDGEYVVEETLSIILGSLADAPQY